MRTHLRVLAAAALALSLASVAAADSDRVKAFIPFDFIVRGQTMTAGTYYVSHQYANGLLGISSLKQGVFILGNRTEVTDLKNYQTRLVFHRYGDHYFLNQVWMDEGRGYQLPESIQEKEMAKTASAAKPVETVTIAMNK